MTDWIVIEGLMSAPKGNSQGNNPAGQSGKAFPTVHITLAISPSTLTVHVLTFISINMFLFLLLYTNILTVLLWKRLKIAEDTAVLTPLSLHTP